MSVMSPPGAMVAGIPLGDQPIDAARASDGRSTAITVMTPIKPGATSMERLVLFLGAHIKRLNAALSELGFIHYARWTIITGFPNNGDPQEPEKLHYDYLFFETNFNGTWDEYIDAFSEVIPERMTAIWGSSFGFPGPQPVGPFKAYIHANDLPIAHYYGAYPDATTRMVLSALQVQRKYQSFQARVATLQTSEEFAEAYDDFMTDIQHDI
jgi:hypothetical protein